MSANYVAVSWNHHKRRYDLAVAMLVGGYLLLFVGVGKLSFRGLHAISDEVLMLRALGSCAFLLLHVILSIGPLCRLIPSLAPVLYNRRHLGVMTFGIAALHGGLAIGYYHGFGDVNPLVSLFRTGLMVEGVRSLPYQLFGMQALVTLFVLAATSHDFWLNTLSPRVWKSIHMGVYAAYALLVAHAGFGALQTERSPWLAVAVLFGACFLTGLHLATGVRERRRDRRSAPVHEGWLDAGEARSIPENRARIIMRNGGERIAVFRSDKEVFAVENLCAHQGGPLGEGRIVDGCITCPWHGWQYRPGDGCSPPPFTEKLRTYQVKISAGRVLVNPDPLPPGTPRPAAKIEEMPHA